MVNFSSGRRVHMLVVCVQYVYVCKFVQDRRSLVILSDALLADSDIQGCMQGVR
jgi:hypothetical protein